MMQKNDKYEMYFWNKGIPQISAEKTNICRTFSSSRRCLLRGLNLRNLAIFCCRKLMIVKFIFPHVSLTMAVITDFMHDDKDQAYLTVAFYCLQSGVYLVYILCIFIFVLIVRDLPFCTRLGGV